MTERELRIEMCDMGRRLYDKGLIAGLDGNLSVRLPRGRLLTTPSGAAKGFMKCEHLVITDMAGRPMGGGKPSSELRLHLAVYAKRADVNAVIHAHPPTAVAFTLAGASLEQCVMPEVLLYIGTIPTTRYATPASAEGPEVIAELIEKHDALLLDRHGAVTVGKDLGEAWERMEKLEHFAQVVLRARQLGAVRTLSADELARLERTAEELGYKADFAKCRLAGCTGTCAAAGKACESAEGDAAAQGGVDVEGIAAIVAEEVERQRARPAAGGR